MVYSQGAIPCGMPGNGTARVVPDRTAYLPVISAERGALGLDIEVGKAHALCRERIDAWRGRPPNDPTAVNAKIPVTEVIAQHKHHIGLIACAQ